MHDLLEKNQYVQGLAPSADIFNTNPASVAVHGKYAKEICAHLNLSGGTTGKGTIKAQACSASDGTGATDIGFHYKKSVASDTFNNMTEVAAGSSVESTPNITTQQIVASVNPKNLPDNKPWVRFKLDETADDPVKGSLVIVVAVKDVQKQLGTVLT